MEETIVALDPNAWVVAIITLSQSPVFWVVAGLVALWIVCNAWAKSRKQSE